MYFEVGDFISFLDSTEKGLIREVTNKFYLIEIEGMLIKYPKDVKIIKTGTSKVISSNIEESHSKTSIFEHINQNNVSLCFLSAEAGHSLGNLRTFICNNTGFGILISLYTQSETRTQLLFSGKIEINSEVDITNLIKLQELSKLFFQIIFSKSDEIISPYSNSLKIKPRVLADINNFEFINNYGYVLCKSIYEYETGLINKPFISKDYLIRPNTSESYIDDPKFILNKYKIIDNTISLDLHLSALIDNNVKFHFNNDFEKLEFQKNECRKCIEYSLQNSRVQYIVFIHGKGTGRLRYEIEEILKEYENIQIDCGLYKIYNSGETCVKIIRNFNKNFLNY